MDLSITKDLRNLSKTTGITIKPSISTSSSESTKRILRPRTELKSYAETPDVVIMPQKHGYSDSDDEEMPLQPIKVHISFLLIL